jgi:hypothetical protein
VLTGMHMSSAQHLNAGFMHYWYKSAHTHMMLVGFAMMAANSLALCLLPPAPQGSWHRSGFDTLAFWLISLGTVTRFGFECALGYLAPEPVWIHHVILASSTLAGLGLILFWLNQWPRIRGNQE